MPDTITITGLVATAPRHILTSEGLSITSFRLASNQRRFDRAQERWIDVETNWYSIVSFRQLALNASSSIEKGQRVIVTGRLRIREWDNGERVGTTVEVEADSIGHDLAWGTASFSRTIVSSTAQPVEEQHEPESPQESPDLESPDLETPDLETPELETPIEERHRPELAVEAVTPF